MIKMERILALLLVMTMASKFVATDTTPMPPVAGNNKTISEDDLEAIHLDKKIVQEISERELKQNADNGLTLKSISNEILPDISKYSEFWETYEPPYEIRKAYPYYHSGYDHEGRPIWIEETGKWNMRKAVEAGGETYKHFDRNAIQSMYQMIQSVNRSSTPDDPVDGIIFICDFDGFTLEQVTHVPTLTYLVGLMRRYFGHLDANLHQVIVVNNNAVAQTFLNIMRPILGRVFERAEIYGTNKAKYIPQILKRCPKDSIPKWYGGKDNFKPVKVYG